MALGKIHLHDDGIVPFGNAMDDLETRSRGLIRSPIGCDFLLIAEMLGFRAPELGRADIALHLAARAVSDLSVWRQDHSKAIEAALAEGPRLLPIARDLLRRDAARWWFGPFDRDAQIWVVPFDHGAAPAPAVDPPRRPTEFDRYIQRPFGALVTTTLIDGTIPMLAAEREGAGDLGGTLRPPLVRYRLIVSPHARIFSIDAPADWRRLCEAFPATEPGGLHGGLLTPDFSAVAREWDAVHLSFGGVLSAVQAPLDGPGGRTELDSWEIEQTVWLRWVFDDATRLPDVLEAIPSPL